MATVPSAARISDARNRRIQGGIPRATDGYRMQTVLVTGGAGYVGSLTCKRLCAEGYEPVLYDNLSTGHRDLARWGHLEVGDLRDADRVDRVLARYKPASVLHFAGSAYVGESVRDPGKYFDNNVCASLALLEACVRAGVRDVVFSSSCATYGVPSSVPITEAADQDPINPYGASKLMVERMLRDFGAAHGLRSVSLRYFNAAGADPEGEAGECHQPETHLLPLLLDVAAGKRDEAMVLGTDYPTRDGPVSATRSMFRTFADAHVRAMRYLARGGETSSFNLGGGEGVTVLEAIEEVRSVTGRAVPWRPEPRRPGDPPELIAAVDRARTVLEWRPERSDLTSILHDAWYWHQHGRSAAGLDP
jgi:UDP-glucose-4-epimerase GalE